MSWRRAASSLALMMSATERPRGSAGAAFGVSVESRARYRGFEEFRRSFGCS
jgi:hypothetical protein